MAFEREPARKGILIKGQWVFTGDSVTVRLNVVDKRTLQKYKGRGLVVMPLLAPHPKGGLIHGFYMSEAATKQVLEIGENMIDELSLPDPAPEVSDRIFPPVFPPIDTVAAVPIPENHPVRLRAR